MARSYPFLVRSLLIVLCFFADQSLAQDVHVRAYTRSNGTEVQAHYRSAPDGDFDNNWSTLGNVNPYTGEPGTLISPPSYQAKDGISDKIEDDGESDPDYDL